MHAPISIMKIQSYLTLKILFSISVLKLDILSVYIATCKPWRCNSQLATRNLQLATRNSQLATRNSQITQTPNSAVSDVQAENFYFQVKFAILERLSVLLKIMTLETGASLFYSHYIVFVKEKKCQYLNFLHARFLAIVSSADFFSFQINFLNTFRSSFSVIQFEFRSGRM